MLFSRAHQQCRGAMLHACPHACTGMLIAVGYDIVLLTDPWWCKCLQLQMMLSSALRVQEVQEARMSTR
jgi:hypothetical protein